MALGVASHQLDLLDPVTRFCDEALPPNSVFGFLHEHRDMLFPDGLFTDLFAVNGRRSVPPSVVAAVMVLQRFEGLSDREAVDRVTFDARWRYAAGVVGWDGGGRSPTRACRAFASCLSWTGSTARQARWTAAVEL